MPLSPGFNAVTTKASEVPKIMGYLKSPGGGRRGSSAEPRCPLCWPCKRAVRAKGLGGSTGSCPEPRRRRRHSPAHRAEGTGWVGAEKRQNQEPRALVYGWASGGKGERGQEGNSTKRREPHGRFRERKKKKKRCNLFFKKPGHSIAERQRVNERQRRLLL